MFVESLLESFLAVFDLVGECAAAAGVDSRVIAGVTCGIDKLDPMVGQERLLALGDIKGILFTG